MLNQREIQSISEIIKYLKSRGIQFTDITSSQTLKKFIFQQLLKYHPDKLAHLSDLEKKSYEEVCKKLNSLKGYLDTYGEEVNKIIDSLNNKTKQDIQYKTRKEMDDKIRREMDEQLKKEYERHKKEAAARAAQAAKAAQEREQQPLHSDSIILKELKQANTRMSQAYQLMQQKNLDPQTILNLYKEITDIYWPVYSKLNARGFAFNNLNPELQRQRQIFQNIYQESTKISNQRKHNMEEKQPRQEGAKEKMLREFRERKAKEKMEEELKQQYKQPKPEQYANNVRFFRQQQSPKPQYQAPQETPETLLNEEQITLARKIFSQNRSITKIKKNQRYNIDNKIVSFPFSVIKTEEGKLFAMYNGKQANNNYLRKQGLLGKGSFGRVKLAVSLDAPYNIVAAKVQIKEKLPRGADSIIASEEAARQAMHQYISAADNRNLRHETKHYTFSEFIDGQSLYSYYRQNMYRMTTQDKLNMVLKVLNALQNLHNQDLIHGDFSFNNILIDKTGNLHIIDFGLAGKKSQEKDYIQPPLLKIFAGLRFNKDHYHSPEIYQGRIYRQSDIYSLGKWIAWTFGNTEPMLKNLASNMTQYLIQNRKTLDACRQEIESELRQINRAKSGKR